MAWAWAIRLAVDRGNTVFCPKCGAMLPNDAVFCKECGVRMGQALTNSKRNRAVLIAIVLAAAIIAAGGYAVWHSSTHKEVGVDVTIAADGWGDGSSPVPFTITDTDLDGKQVSKTVCLNPSDGSIQLQRGTYTIAAAGSPVTSAGGIFTYPSDILNVTVDKDGAHVGEQSLDKATFAYTAIAPENVSDAQLQAITDWMAAAGIDSAKASAWVESARAARSSRQSEVAADRQFVEFVIRFNERHFRHIFKFDQLRDEDVYLGQRSLHSSNSEHVQHDI